MREIARDGTTVTYDAVQLALDRPVTLTVLAPDDPRGARFRADAWPEHPHVVSLFAAGASDDGFFLATRRVPGAATLRRRVADGADPASWLADVRAALVATGAVHGALDDETALLIDAHGRVLITGFGLGPPEATAADDEGALMRLQDGAPVSPPAAPARPARGRAVAAAGVAVAAASALALALVAAPGDDGAGPDGTPGLAAGAVLLGSALPAGAVRTVDCDGEAPSGRSLACTVLQRSRRGRRLIAARDGVVVAWHVRAARGDMALRVIRPRGAGRFAMVGGSDFESVDGGLRSFRATIPVRRGDRLGLQLAPGSAAGFRAAVPGAATMRFIGPLGVESRLPDPAGAAGRDEELLLRVDYVPGRAVQRPVRLAGVAAAAAPAGRRLDERELAVAGGRAVTAAVVALPGGVAVDVFTGTRRRARITVPGAHPRGRLTLFTAKGEADLTLGWSNPDGTRIETPYVVTATSIAPRP